MTLTPPALAYRRAAAQQASAVGLVIALYDTLAGDLTRAAEALRSRDIEERAAQLKHGFTVLAQLHGLLDSECGGQAALNLQRFYEHLRREMLRAQFMQEPSVLDRARHLLIEVRGAWHEVDARSSTNSGFPARDEPLAHSRAAHISVNCLA